MNNIKPVHYRIHLEPDLERFQFSGSTEILLEADEAVEEVALNALDLAVWRCNLNADGEDLSCPFTMDPEKEILRVGLPKAEAGKIELKIDYVGEINNNMAGFYRSRQVTKEGETTIAVTQFEESDARRAFPCFDHPERKATFDVEMVIDEGLEAISNSPVLEENPLGAGKKLIKFETTPKMSTYLLFFGVGKFEFIEDQGVVSVRVAAMPGMAEYGRFGLEFGRKSLDFSETYYGIKYPLKKLDLIAIADFAAGAMENWGAITFRENLLLHFPNITSREGEQRICEVIAHEMAHQWFGNLVTPSDWKYLWLNESFATYFGYGIVNHYYPEWDLWAQFLHGQTDTAFERDSLHETFPIEIPGGEHVVINASTAPIIYNKGGSILRQVEGYLGEESFQEGLRHYLKKHEYGCASSHHLWEALEEASKKPVSSMMKSWIEQPGFPIVEVERDSDRLIFHQRRFTYLHEDWEQSWVIPVAVRVCLSNGDSKTLHTLLDREKTVLEMGQDILAYKVNEGQRGFYRVKYRDEDNLRVLGKLAAEKAIPSEDRWGLQNDLFALVKRGDIVLREYLDFLSNFKNEDAFLPMVSIAGNLFFAYLVVGEHGREDITTIGKSLCEQLLGHLGYEPAKDERHTTAILREILIWHAVIYGSKGATAFAEEKFSALMKGERVHPDILKSAMRVGAWNGKDGAFAWFDGRLQSSESEHERMNILTALGCFRDQDLIERVQAYILKKVPDRNKFFPAGSLSLNPCAIPTMWAWYRTHLREIEQFHPVHYERVIAGIVPFGGLGREDDVKRFFKDYMAKTEKAKDVIKLSLERLEINSRMRQSQGKA